MTNMGFAPEAAALFLRKNIANRARRQRSELRQNPRLRRYPGTERRADSSWIEQEHEQDKELREDAARDLDGSWVE